MLAFAREVLQVAVRHEEQAQRGYAGGTIVISAVATGFGEPLIIKGLQRAIPWLVIWTDCGHFSQMFPRQFCKVRIIIKHPHRSGLCRVQLS